MDDVVGGGTVFVADDVGRLVEGGIEVAMDVLVEGVALVVGREVVAGMTGIAHEKARTRRTITEASRKLRLKARPLTFIKTISQSILKQFYVKLPVSSSAFYQPAEANQRHPPLVPGYKVLRLPSFFKSRKLML